MSDSILFKYNIRTIFLQFFRNCHIAWEMVEPHTNLFKNLNPESSSTSKASRIHSGISIGQVGLLVVDTILPRHPRKQNRHGGIMSSIGIGGPLATDTIAIEKEKKLLSAHGAISIPASPWASAVGENFFLMLRLTLSRVLPSIRKQKSPKVIILRDRRLKGFFNTGFNQLNFYPTSQVSKVYNNS